MKAISPQRDLRIDTIRGLLLVIMTLNHTHNALRYQGWIQTLTVAPFGFVTGAEGFIFISGFVIGMVYVKYSQPLALFKKTTSRAKTVYLHHLLPLFGLYILAFAFPILAFTWKRELSFYYLGKRTLMAEALLLYQPEIFDILPIYVFFILFTPLLLLLLKRKWGWLMILVISFLFWGIGQFIDPLCIFNEMLFPEHRCGWFNVMIWQVLYVLGAVLGYHRPRLGKIRFFQRPIFVISIISAALLLFLLRHGYVDSDPWLAANVLQKNLAWLRIVNLMVLAALLGLLFKKLPRRACIPGVVFFGQHSLQVFAFHVLLIYFITPLRVPICAQLNDFTYPLFMLLVVASLLIPAYVHQKWQTGAATVTAKTLMR
jgi:hypothetical protein